MDNTNTEKYILPPDLIRLHVRLKQFFDSDTEMLRKYGGVKRSATITRDIIAQKDIPLQSLHFVLQRAFGFQESHMHKFFIYGEDELKVTGNKMENLLNLLGIIFKQMSDFPDTPMYTGGSFKNWLRKQYTAPFRYAGDPLSKYHSLKKQIGYSPDTMYYKLTELHPDSPDPKNEKAIKKRFFGMATVTSTIDELTGNGPCVKWKKGMDFQGNPFVRCKSNDPDAMSYEKIRFGDLDVQSGISVIRDELTDIIERLRICDVLAVSPDDLPYDEKWNRIHPTMALKQPQVFTKDDIRDALQKRQEITPQPFVDVLGYIYDFGDNWHLDIIGSQGCSDLIEGKVITKTELDRSVQKALKEKHPVLVARDGEMLIEDCGNVQGFISFMKQLNRSQDDMDYDEDYDDEDYDEEEEEDDGDSSFDGMSREELIDWATSQGWHEDDALNINLL